MSAYRPRLGPEDWLRAGLSALATSGPGALKAEALARDIGTTKGSFYWHFKDIGTFRATLCEFWLGRAEAILRDAAQIGATPAERLRRIEAIAGTEASDVAAEAAIRAWARYDRTASDVVARIDKARIAHIRSVLEALGLTNPEFARIVYAAHLGMLALPDGGAANASARSTLAAALLALQEA